jgi:shikimate dehydrogenase
MSRAAVLGRPVAHSLSPVLHRAAYAALGLTDWSYDALDIGADDLPILLAGLGEEWRGFSVTMPCKQAAVDVADLVEPLPGLLHAANTLVRTDDGWRAENTDVGGIGMTLQLGGVAEVGAATVVGAGGTAAATAVALASLGAEHVDVVVREPSRAGDVTRVLDVLGVPFSVTRLAEAALDSPLVVSTVPITGQPDLLHLPWRGGHTVLDVLYAPWPTPLAQRVTAVGGRVVCGLEVLFWQATAQVELMTGHEAPIGPMRSALDAAVAAR